MNISDYFKKNLIQNFNLEHEQNLSDKIKYYNNAKADAIHCYQGIKKYLHKDKKILEVGGVFICLPAFYNKIMILLPLNREVLLALPMNYAIKF